MNALIIDNIKDSCFNTNFLLSSFKCVNCHVVSKMDWVALLQHSSWPSEERGVYLKNKEHLYLATCHNCAKNSFWKVFFDWSTFLKEDNNFYSNTTSNAGRILHNETPPFLNQIDFLKKLDQKTGSTWLNTFYNNAVMVFPTIKIGPPPDKDMPEILKVDYEEARSVANISPRAAAALLRLCIQNLCIHLVPENMKEKSINDMIGYLVEKKLVGEKEQKMLDSVRVIGNNAVHPSKLEIADFPETVNLLFYIVTKLIYSCITEPAEINSLYASLPPNSLEGIKIRDTA